ncbi:MAG: sugar phosphate nucleotidyltransferase [Pseudomonadota bacterium]
MTEQLEKKIYPLILCGGSGTRLWPLSRTRSPKQFQRVGGKDSLTFFQSAIKRHQGSDFHAPVIVTSLRHRGTVISQLRDIQCDSQLICEPMGRNTGPAVLAAAHTLHGRDPNAVILVIPADHVIEGEINAEIVKHIDAALAGNIITFGIKPRSPETGFGYICQGPTLEGFPELNLVSQFVEKPEEDKAQQLIEHEGATWASGLSMFSAKTIIDEYQINDVATASYVARSVMGASPFPEALYLDADDFSQATNLPTEKAVFEKSEAMCTVTLDCTWSDVGSWAAMHEVSAADENGNVLQGDVIAVDTRNTMVRSDGRLVGVIGLDDVVVVDTTDALLVTSREKSQDVRHVVDELKKKARPEAEFYAGSAPKMVPFSMPKGLEQVLQKDNFQLGTTQIPIGAAIDIDQGHGRQVIVVNGSVHAHGPSWQKMVREGGRIYSDPDGPIRVTNTADVATELLFMTFDMTVESPKSFAAQPDHG